jgi:hypothetical protein
MLVRLLSLVLFLTLGWLLARLLGLGRRAPRADRRGRGASVSDGAMVRDRVCNTFLPRSRAIVVREGGAEWFFCSERCRDAHLRAAASSPSPGAGRA